MEYFEEVEFNGWFDDVNRELRVRLDFLRLIADCPISLSKLSAGIGRHAGPDNKSQHNVDYWGEVMAVDGLIPDKFSYRQFYELCLKAGFTGIGLYSGWHSGRGFHVDVRKTDAVAKWSAIYNPNNEGRKTVYYSIDMLLES